MPDLLLEEAKKLAEGPTFDPLLDEAKALANGPVRSPLQDILEAQPPRPQPGFTTSGQPVYPVEEPAPQEAPPRQPFAVSGPDPISDVRIAEPSGDPLLDEVRFLIEGPSETEVQAVLREIGYSGQVSEAGNRIMRALGTFGGSAPKMVAMVKEEMSIALENLFQRGELPKGAVFRGGPRRKDGKRQAPEGPPEPDADRVRNSVYFRFGNDVQKMVEGYWQTRPELDPSLRMQVAEAIGQAGVFAASVAVGGPAAAAALGVSLESVDIFERAKAGGASDEDALLTASYGIPSGAIEVIPAARLFKRFNKASGGQLAKGIASTLKAMAAGGIEEATQEWVQTQIGNKALRDIGINDPALMEDALRAGEVGGIVGVLLNALGISAGRIRGRLTRRGQEAPPTPPVAPSEQLEVTVGEQVVVVPRETAQTLVDSEATSRTEFNRAIPEFPKESSKAQREEALGQMRTQLEQEKADVIAQRQEPQGRIEERERISEVRPPEEAGRGDRVEEGGEVAEEIRTERRAEVIAAVKSGDTSKFLFHATTLEDAHNIENTGEFVSGGITSLANAQKFAGLEDDALVVFSREELPESLRHGAEQFSTVEEARELEEAGDQPVGVVGQAIRPYAVIDRSEGRQVAEEVGPKPKALTTPRQIFDAAQAYLRQWKIGAEPLPGQVVNSDFFRFNNGRIEFYRSMDKQWIPLSDKDRGEWANFLTAQEGVQVAEKAAPIVEPPSESEPHFARTTPQKETSGPTLSKKAKQARKEAGEALDELGDYMATTTFANPLADPELIKRVATLVVKSVKAGVLTFADFVRATAKRIGVQRTKLLGPLLESEWRRHRKLNPRMDEPGEVDVVLNVTTRATPVSRSPGIEQLPNVDEANDSTPLDLIDQWFGDRDVAIVEAELHTGTLQDRVKELVGTKSYSKQAQELDQAIALNIDLHGKPEQIGKYGDNLTPEQQRIYERSQNLSEEEQALANQIRTENTKFGKHAQEAGVIGSYLENYTARLWETEKELRKGVLARLRITPRFQTTTARAKKRTLESILHGWSLGKTLQVTGATNAQLLARTEIAKVIADRNLINLGAKAGLLSDKQLEGWRRIEHPNFRKWIWIGKVEEGKTYGREVFISEEGDVFRRAELYAEPKLAKHLNNALGRSALEGIPFIDWVTKWNAIIKHFILTTSFFHHQAFGRSSMLGSASPRVIKAYAEGKKAIQNYTQELRDLVRAGLTIGRVQDWEEDYLHQKTAIGKVLDKVPMAGEIKDKLLEQRDRQTNFLFRRLGAHLKVQYALLEYRRLLLKHADKLRAGTATRHIYAKMAASIANDDFGGLHLGRMGRNPTVQHIFRLLTLAPDWTESNVRSMVKAMKAGDEGAVYRALWSRVLVRGLGATILFNFVLAAADDFGDDDETVAAKFLKRWSRAWKEGHMRWLEIDITPIYRALGGDNEKRKWFSLIGHFRDPLKFILHPIRSAKHKGSVLSRIVLEAVMGTDWAGRSFTTFAELLGIDDKGVYKTTVKGRHKKGEPKGGKLKGRLVGRSRGGRPLEFGQYPSFMLSQTYRSMPIPMQNAIGWFAGELDGFDALTKGVGLMTSTTYPPTDPRKAIVKYMDLDDAVAANAALDRLVREELQANPQQAVASPRLRYVGRLAYSATDPKTPGEEAVKLLDFLRIDYREAQMSLNVYWRSRGLNYSSDKRTERLRRLRRVFVNMESSP